MIRKQLVLIAFFTFLISNFSLAQKLKYKDIFDLIKVKNYTAVEPLLKSYLSIVKNSDHPNANLNMAIVYHQKSIKEVDDSGVENQIVMIDSAIYYYNKAKLLISKNEIKSNDKYYKEYYRRDLRTGKMGIKLSDIRLDIDNRTSELNELRENQTKLSNN